IETVMLPVAVDPRLPVALTPKVYVPIAVGVPESTPVVASPKPGGSVLPGASTTVRGAVSPVVAIVAEYGSPTVPEVRPLETIETGPTTCSVVVDAAELSETVPPPALVPVTETSSVQIAAATPAGKAKVKTALPVCPPFTTSGANPA